MLALGFSSGLPFLLTGNTFGYWLRDEGASLSAIGFISWVGIAYSMKFVWAPFVDRVVPPVAGRLGHRRGWMLVSQIAVAAGLFSMASLGTAHGLLPLGCVALVVAFASATQDIVIDAWRIESAGSGEELGLLTSAYQFGYRIALLATDALILVAAAHIGWPVSYMACALAMLLGIVATFAAREPAKADAVIEEKARERPLTSTKGLADAIAGPFLVFFRLYGWIAILMLIAISLYRLPDFVMGPMANPFYHDIGLSKTYVGEVRGTIGVAAALLGIAAGGACALRFGYVRALIVGGILQAIAIASFAALARHNPSAGTFAAVMSADNFSTSFAGVALVSYMSSLTTLGYTATQYALLSSTYAWVGKIAKGFSGVVVENLAAKHGLMAAYEVFFIGAGAIGIPAILLFLVLSVRHRATRVAVS
ncbi:MAG TPA: MFS transporter [Rhizomicrobium sp.]|jgi:PAT family beta-lactamase induction signal transducer AmpG|nr:MFS transporter [Rhizomicrobium sp.]